MRIKSTLYLGLWLRLAGMVLLLLTAFPAVAHAQLTNVQYTTTSDGNGGLIITKFSATGSGPLTIASTINGLPVTSIGNFAFSYCNSLTSSVTIPDTVTSIGQDAFEYASGITSVIMSNSVTSIGQGAFTGCMSLTSVTIPSSVTSIGSGAFANCLYLTAITMAASNAYYSSADGVLFNNDQTTLIEYPGGRAGSYTIPNSVTSIGQYAFSACPRLTSVTISNGVIFIGDYAFYGCSGLTNVTIPNSVIYIGNYAFSHCASLTSAIFQGNAPTMGTGVFLSDPSGFAVYYCNGAIGFTSPTWTDSSGDAYPAKAQFTTVSDGRGGLIITGYTFLGRAVSIPSAINGLPVTSIAGLAFGFCTTLTSVTIPNSVISIGIGAFKGCTSLTSVIIPNSVTSIGATAFFSCTSLTSVTIPSSVTGIGYGPFDSCTSLTSITVSPQNSFYSSVGGVLFDKTQTMLIQYPEGLTNSSYTIPNSVTSIGDGAFEVCTMLTSVTIPNSVTRIGNLSFESCSGLTSVTIPNSVTSIGTGAFESCSGLTSVTIPNSVTSIGDEAFVDCTILTSAVFQGNAPTMGTSVFVGCANGFTVDFYNGATGFTSPTWRDGNGSGNVYPAVNLGTLPDNSVATDTPTMPPWALVTLAMLLIATGSQFLPKPAVGIKF